MQCITRARILHWRIAMASYISNDYGLESFFNAQIRRIDARLDRSERRILKARANQRRGNNQESEKFFGDVYTMEVRGHAHGYGNRAGGLRSQGIYLEDDRAEE